MTKENPTDISDVPFEVHMHCEDETVAFKTYVDFSDWAKAQLDQWAPAANLVNRLGGRSQQAFQFIESSFRTMRNLANNIVEDGTSSDAQQARQALPKHIQALQLGSLPTAGSPIGISILEGMDSDPDAAAARLMWAGRLGMEQNINVSGRFLAELIQAGIDDQVGQTAPRVHKARLTRLHREWDNRFAENESEVHRRLSQGINVGGKAIRRIAMARRDHRAAIVEHQQELDRLEAAFKERLRLDAPAVYWTKRRLSQTYIAVFAFIGFLVVTFAALALLEANWQDITTLVDKGGGGFNLLPAIVLTVPAILLLWVLRLISRVFISSLASARDAALRSTLILTYLALTAEPEAGMQEADRLLILQALFRPEHAGPDDDAPPPNLLEIITRSSGRN